MTITGWQFREARARLGWDRSKLARRANVPIGAVHRAEAVDDEPQITTAQKAALKHAFGSGGIDFTVDPPGVHLRAPRLACPDEA